MIRHIIKYAILKWKWRGKVRFSWSSRIDFHSEFEGMNQIHPHTDFSGYMGYGSYVASHSSLYGKIGKFCSIASYVRCNNGRHPYTYPYVTTAPCFFSSTMFKHQNGWTFATKQKYAEFTYANDAEKYAVEIGNDCWIGEGAFLVGGIKIGDGAVVLAHAVVTKDVPPYAIVGGVPAKILKYRYTTDDIDFLLKIKWWNNPVHWFADNWEKLNDINQLKEEYNAT
ncbi:CatB-related O-acetyltransferase [uncultured Muribaculum sp.]|uniref:CatB-related O-acetyltransferase n=1 Tax=uncultured Muribaculum sp. TaxID=1918613 RepID=UPI00259A5C33|nr:CatB-related O-acetyltransferase [uncultured Muribaculum sp.]